MEDELSGATGQASGRNQAGRRERGLAFGLCLFLLLFGAVVEFRSAYLHYRHTDADVFFRAAWAVRTGRDPYTITDPNGWHYHYPLLFAIALMPLADAPPAYPRIGLVPYKLAVAIWYGFNLLMLAWVLWTCTRMLKRARQPRAGPVPGAFRAQALWPAALLVCLAPVAVTLERGQTNLLLLALVCAWMAATLAGHSLRAGIWPALAACLKLFPIYLTVYALWRRDFRMLLGCGLGLVVGFVLVPALALGPAQTIADTQEWVHVLLAPALFNGSDRSRAAELLDINGTDNISFKAAFHNWANLKQTLTLARDRRTNRLEPWVGPAHWMVAAMLTALTLMAAGWRRDQSTLGAQLTLASLVFLMVPISPISHFHYFTLELPLVMGLLAAAAMGGGAAQLRLWRMLAVVMVLWDVPLLPRLDFLHDLGMATVAGLILWVTACLWVWRERETQPASSA